MQLPASLYPSESIRSPEKPFGYRQSYYDFVEDELEQQRALELLRLLISDFTLEFSGPKNKNLLLDVQENSLFSKRKIPRGSTQSLMVNNNSTRGSRHWRQVDIATRILIFNQNISSL